MSGMVSEQVPPKSKKSGSTSNSTLSEEMVTPTLVEKHIALENEEEDRKLPPNLKDPVRFSIPCAIGNRTFGNALCDLEASKELPLERVLCLPQNVVKESEDPKMKEVLAMLEESPSYSPRFPTRWEKLKGDEDESLEKNKEKSHIELKQLPPHLKYVFLGEKDKNSAIISASLSDLQEDKLLRILQKHKGAIDWSIEDLKGISPTFYGYSGYNKIVVTSEDQEKITFTCPYRVFSYQWMLFGLCNAPASFQRCMNSIFSNMIEKHIEVFMDDFFVFGSSFDNCLINQSLVLERGEKSNLVLNWEKCHFMVRKGIVLGHRISHKGIEVDKPKVEVIEKLSPPTNEKGIRSFLAHNGFYRRFRKDFSKVAKPLTNLLVKDTPFKFNEDCLNVFNILKHKLITAPIITAPDWSLPFEIMFDASNSAIGAIFGHIKDKLLNNGSKNNVADHLSRLEKVEESDDTRPIRDQFDDENIFAIAKAPWSTEFANFKVGEEIPSDFTYQQ
ncbi:uncharacterized protein [Cicer arietinum]|uniref:Uncharacterized protein LOC105853114 n=1 Tax=Cicer arietinum TaxID=3827 RepID=A0A1S3EJR4_CICAR|nr:uncharacterized protein LOC105853114 [Cicer arietinum]